MDVKRRLLPVEEIAGKFTAPANGLIAVPCGHNLSMPDLHGWSVKTAA